MEKRKPIVISYRKVQTNSSLLQFQHVNYRQKWLKGLNIKESSVRRQKAFMKPLKNLICTVYVFSNYPCKQAELNMEPYLNITAEEESEDEEEIKE